MAMIDAATLVINSGNYLTAPTSTVLPTNLLVPPAPWDKIGHTSLDEIMSIASEGGEATVLGTLQNKSLRTVYSSRTETFSLTLQQFDAKSLRLYYGANAVTLGNGTVGNPANPMPTVCAFLAVFIDGTNLFAFYAPKVEIFRGDDLSLSDTESLAGLPLSVKPLIDGTNTYSYAITPLGVAATGAIAGSPGSFTPLNAVAPATFAGLTGVVASPVTAWTTGQNVILGDGSLASWTGTAWAVGARP